MINQANLQALKDSNVEKVVASEAIVKKTHLSTTSKASVNPPSTLRKISDKTKNKLNKIILLPDGSIKPFEQIQVSTTTGIVVTNCTVDLHKLFKYAPIIDFEPQEKKRGRKPRFNVDKPVTILPFGSVTSIQHELNKRGNKLVVNKETQKEKEALKSSNTLTIPNTTFRIPNTTSIGQPSNLTANLTQVNPTVKRKAPMLSNNTTPSKVVKLEHPHAPQVVTTLPSSSSQQPPEAKKSYFLHCVSVVIVISDSNDKDNETKNVKVYRNGKLQITGCRDTDQYIQTIKAVFKLFATIEKYTGESVVVCSDSNYKAIVNVVMKNRDFFMGFEIYRNNMDYFINNFTQFRSSFEGSMNTCVNIKIPLENFDDNLVSIDFNKTTEQFVVGQVKWDDYKHILQKKNKKEAEHTFLLFSTGHVIFSSCGPDSKRIYESIVGLLIKSREHFELIRG